jgi:hypothetical protein
MKWPSQSPREHLSRPLTGNFTDYVGGDLGERRLAQRFPAVADTEEVTWGRTRGSVELQVSCPKPQVSATAMNPRHRSKGTRDAFEVASAGDALRLRAYKSDWQTLWQTRLPGLRHTTGPVSYSA